MIARTGLIALMLLTLAACGVKTDLDPPAGAHVAISGESKAQAKAEADKRVPDPSKPPHPLGQ